MTYEIARAMLIFAGITAAIIFVALMVTESYKHLAAYNAGLAQQLVTRKLCCYFDHRRDVWIVFSSEFPVPGHVGILSHHKNWQIAIEKAIAPDAHEKMLGHVLPHQRFAQDVAENFGRQQHQWFPVGPHDN